MGMASSDDAITRSEEELHLAGTQVRAIGRVRLVKRIVTEYVDVRVALRREELHVFEEPLTGEAAVPGGLELGDDTLELILHAEEPVVDTRIVPRERVRVHLDVVQEEQVLEGELRREVVDLEEGPPRW